MIIRKFRVKNYKSIIDSGDCYLEDTLTIFAGKNESGKSSLLEALESFNTAYIIQKEDITMDSDEDDFSISITFIVSPKELDTYFKKIGSSVRINEHYNIEISKDYYDKYTCSLESKNFLQLENDDINNLRKNYHNLIDSLKVDADNELIEINKSNKELIDFINFDIYDIEVAQQTIDAYYDKLLKVHNDLIEDIIPSEIYSNYVKIVKKIVEEFNNLNSLEKGLDIKWKSFLELLPNFVLFKSFEDSIPNSVPIKNIESNNFIRDFQTVTGLDISLFKSKDIRRLHMHKDFLNMGFNKTYAQYWTQDNNQFKIDWDSEDLYIWVVEEGKLYRPEQRSKGKQWHLSFYLKILARTNETKTNVILVDEPGLFLHASAQRDIYSRLLDSSAEKNTQVIFTTHSPYLIRGDELHRVRLIEKENLHTGTVIINKVHARADKETLTPIMTAIGLDLNQGIQNLGQLYNVVVEGPADTIYLNALSKLVGENELNFVFGGGSSNMGNVGTILGGWGCKVLYLFDNDKGKTDGEKILKRDWAVKRELIASITESSGAIEDIFNSVEFGEFVIGNAIQFDGSNSEYIKDANRKRETRVDKVMIARNFLSKVNKGDVNLSDGTNDIVRALFEKLKFMIKNNNPLD